MSKRSKPIETTMSREEVLRHPIWTSRLIFCSKRVTGKIWKDCNEEEQYQVKKYIIENYEV